jgi:hypothetical protein
MLTVDYRPFLLLYVEAVRRRFWQYHISFVLHGRLSVHQYERTKVLRHLQPHTPLLASVFVSLQD